MRKCGIYKVTSPTKKVYIGQSVNIDERFKQYRALGCKYQPKLYHSLVRHGWKKHKFEVLQLCSEEELGTLEKYYMELYQSYKTEHGLNLRPGGSTYPHAKRIEIGRKVSAAQKGRKLSPERCEIISKSLLGNKRCLGYKHSEETKQKLTAIRTGKKMPASVKKCLVESRSIKINQFDLQGIFINQWPTITSAAKHVGCTPANIKLCLEKKTKASSGFKWEYVDKNYIHKPQKNPCKQKPVNRKKQISQYTKEGIFIKTWDSATEASKYFNCSNSAFWLVLNGKGKYSQGYIWKYTT